MRGVSNKRKPEVEFRHGMPNHSAEVCMALKLNQGFRDGGYTYYLLTNQTNKAK